MMGNMKIVSVNIEGERHLQRVKDFLGREDADLVCLQECFEDRVEELAGELYPYRVFAPNCQGDQDERGFVTGSRKWGVVVMAKEPFTQTEIYYADNKGGKVMSVAVRGKGTHLPAVVVVEVGGYQIATTHFTWTDGGAVSMQQRADFGRLWDWMEQKGELVMLGDFNLPRGNEIYQEMARRYRDNIPEEVTTTIDPKLHRVNKNNLGELVVVVDYVWSTPKYSVKNVRVVSGVSDHCGVVATLAVTQ